MGMRAITAPVKRTSHNRHTAPLAALALGAGVTWNISNVGSVAGPLADAYGSSLAVVGLFTTALFATHLLSQLPAGRGADRIGARNIGLVAVAAVVVGNIICLATPEPAVALLGRAIVGIGSGAGFVAGSDYARAASASPLLQGLYGGSTMAGGGLAIAVVPQLDGWLGWRAPYWSALAIGLTLVVVLALAPADTRTPTARANVLADRRLLPLAVIHGATFGLSVVAANWVVDLLTSHGHEESVSAILGSFLLLAGVLTRPLGGLALRRRPQLARRNVAVALLVGGAAAATLALPLPLALLGLAALIAGLSAGVPFAAVFVGAQRLRPDAPGAAVGFVNAGAILTVVVGTPLAGLAFSLPGEGRLAFAAIGALWAASVLALRRSPV
jgi:MFS family permease